MRIDRAFGQRLALLDPIAFLNFDPEAVWDLILLFVTVRRSYDNVSGAFDLLKPGFPADLRNDRRIFRLPSFKQLFNPRQTLCNILCAGDAAGVERSHGQLDVYKRQAREGADIVIAYFNEHRDAQETKQHVEKLGRKCLVVSGDLKKEAVAQEIVRQTMHCFGKIDVLVNNHAVQFVQRSILDRCV